MPGVQERRGPIGPIFQRKPVAKGPRRTFTHTEGLKQFNRVHNKSALRNGHPLGTLQHGKKHLTGSNVLRTFLSFAGQNTGHRARVTS